MAQEEAAHFPLALAGSVAINLSAREFARLNGCCRLLLTPPELQSLWLHYCHAEGFARRVSQDARLTDKASPLQPAMSCQVDWSVCFQLNVEARVATRAINRLHEMCNRTGVSPPPGIVGPVYATVRLGNEDISLPAQAEENDDSHYSEHRAWLCSRGWRSVAALRSGLRRMLVNGGDGVPFRFRELLVDRPGALLRRGAFNSTGSGGPTGALVEWPLCRSEAGVWQWSMPPHSLQEEMESFSEEENWHLVPSPQPWGRGNGWLVELCAEDPRAAGGCAAAGTPTSTWAHVGARTPSCEVTVQQLCGEVAKHLSSLGWESSRPVLLASLLEPLSAGGALEPALLLQRDLRWTQGERLLLSEPFTSNPPAASGPQGVGAKEASRERAALPLLMSRNATRPRPPAPPWSETPTTAELVGRGYQIFPGTTDAYKAEKAGEKAGGRQGRRGREAPAREPVLPHMQKLLKSSAGVRQFEFHPTSPDLILAGRTDGVVQVLDHERDVRTHGVKVDTSPVLGLSWLRTQPEMAVVGASQTGSVSLVRCVDGREGFMEHYRLEPFPHLSSLSMCCTDDFFATTGVSTDVGLYDTVTGLRSHTFKGLHQNYINIVRFAHTSPHLFATASFDCTCKVWDLREPIESKRPVRAYDTSSINIMCLFSPDDSKILCSGVDTMLRQFSMDQKEDARGTQFNVEKVPCRGIQSNFRRSVYMADGETVATAATSDRCTRFYSAQAPYQFNGVVDLSGLLARRSKATRASRHHHTAQQAANPNFGLEYVQSLRGHPTERRLLGAILSASDHAQEPHIAKVWLTKP